VTAKMLQRMGSGYIIEMTQLPGRPRGRGAKFRIAEVLGIEINCVEKFKQEAGLFVPAPRR